MAEEPNKMTVKEFREQGYLQELNRLFLHPLGMALEVVLNEDGTERFGEVWDDRDDDEGIIYGELKDIDREKALRIHEERITKSTLRRARFGWAVQPPPS